MQGVVFTIGHGTRATSEIVEMLCDAGVARLVDVRRYPGSRRSPHLARAALEVELPRLGIEYRFEGDALGGRRSRGKEPTRHPAWREPAFQAYADHMDTPEFRSALERLEEAARHVPTAILCAETLWWQCHRRLIADALLARGWKVVHLMSNSRTKSAGAASSPRTKSAGAASSPRTKSAGAASRVKRADHPRNEAMRLSADGWPVFDVGVTGALPLAED